jgi:hypothetical protein
VNAPGVRDKLQAAVQALLFRMVSVIHEAGNGDPHHFLEEMQDDAQLAEELVHLEDGGSKEALDFENMLKGFTNGLGHQTNLDIPKDEKLDTAVDTDFVLTDLARALLHIQNNSIQRDVLRPPSNKKSGTRLGETRHTHTNPHVEEMRAISYDGDGKPYGSLTHGHANRLREIYKRRLMGESDIPSDDSCEGLLEKYNKLNSEREQLLAASKDHHETKREREYIVHEMQRVHNLRRIKTRAAFHSHAALLGALMGVLQNGPKKNAPIVDRRTPSLMFAGV